MTKRATIKDVAKKAEVSISVVSYVMNNTPGQSIPESTRARILTAANELGYSPSAAARGLRTKKAMAIGLVSCWEMTNSIFIEILNGVSKVLDQKGYNIVLCSPNNIKSQFYYVELFKQQQLDGIIFISPYDIGEGFNEEAHVNAIKENKIPAVFINGYTADEALNYIYMDYYNTAYMAVEYLVKLGHQNIGYLMVDDDELTQLQASERLRGFNDANCHYNREKNDQFIFNMNDVNLVVDKIKLKQGPTAIVANKSRYGYLFLKKMLDEGIKVPDEISIIAANTEMYAEYLYPALTTVRLPLNQMGEKGAQLLLKNIDKKGKPEKLKLKNKITERESCRKV